MISPLLFSRLMARFVIYLFLTILKDPYGILFFKKTIIITAFLI